MFAVIFEVRPKPERWEDYLALAKYLRPRLEAIDGFLDNERFASLRQRGHLLSLSIWRDEKAVIRWRTQSEHHGVQETGRFEIFEDYHLRVGEIAADAPRARLDATETGRAKAVTLTEVMQPEGELAPPERLAGLLGLADAMPGLLGHEPFESITHAGKRLVLANWRDAAAADAWTPQRPAGARELRHRLVHVIRDYGMFDRSEAPQYFPERTPEKRAAFD
jgi:heme-degrading monooxygenase HmoA